MDRRPWCSAEGVEAASESHLVAMVAVKGKIKVTRLIHDVNKEIKLHACPHVHVTGYSRPLPVLEVPARYLRRRGEGQAPLASLRLSMVADAGQINAT